MNRFQLLAGSALLLLANLAQAQYVWIDAKGVKQFSDQAPPGDIPAGKILKAPGRAKLTADAAAEAAPQTAAAVPKSLADREADYRKRQKEKTDAEAKAAATAANLAQRQAACDAARSRNAQLATGRRMRSNTPDHAVLDTAGRAAEQATTNQALAECG